MRRILLVLIAAVFSHVSTAADLSDIENFRQYDASLSSSGQPSAKQLRLVAKQGFERVIYLAYTDNSTAIEHEDRVVTEFGMEYVHLPIDFDQPTVSDFSTFFSIMQGGEGKKTLVHCQLNFRASTFSFLYRVIENGVPMLDAKNDLDGIWSPNEVWFRFIREVLQSYDRTENCDGCDWGEHEFIDDAQGKRK